MAPRFLGKTSLAGLHLVQVGEQPVLTMHMQLRDRLNARIGPVATALFSEPVVTWPTADAVGSVSWYTEATGDGEPLASLSADRRAVVAAQLRQILQQITLLQSDPELGPLLHHALALGSSDGVLAVGGRPVLMNWGLAANGAGSAEEVTDRARAWINLYTDALPPPPVPPIAPTVSSNHPASAPVRPVTSPIAPAQQADRTWALLSAALGVAAVFLSVGVVIGIHMVAERLTERPNAVALLSEQATREAMDRQRLQNAALEGEIAARRRLLSADVCVADPAQAPRIGPDRAAAVPPAAMVPPPPGGPQFQGSLAELLTQAVVLVIAPGRGNDGKTATGTGFFVTPELIATNRHVIEGADPAEIMVTSSKLGRTTRAQIAAQTPGSEIGSPDIALLRIPVTTGIQPLAFSSTAAPLDQVIAAGFPGLLMQADEAFGRLRAGDASAMPEIILSDGRINAIQSAPGGMKIIPHSAAVSGGNSGGPLVDACGRVIGINTFITANQEQVAHANYAQKADGVVAFLRQNGANVVDLTGPCTPGTTTAVTPPPHGSSAAPTTAPTLAPAVTPASGPPVAPARAASAVPG